ncbi:MAG: hypothetical protein K2K14_02040, partial [Ruminococcus sp.]|nr:hypothetical protein [Ruminococcus sp.]
SRIAQIAALIGAIACFVVGVIFVFIPADSVTSFNGTATGTIVFDEEKSKMFSFDDENDKMKFIGAELSFDTKETLNGNEREVEIHALAVNFSGKHFKALGIVLSFSGSLLLASLYVVFVFAVSLSKALETCESPFEENVLTAMKKLGYSFIPFGIIHIGLTGISAVTIILMIMLVIAMINIFSYGAKLQQESDDTV